MGGSPFERAEENEVFFKKTRFSWWQCLRILVMLRRKHAKQKLNHYFHLSYWRPLKCIVYMVLLLSGETLNFDAQLPWNVFFGSIIEFPLQEDHRCDVKRNDHELSIQGVGTVVSCLYIYMYIHINLIKLGTCTKNLWGNKGFNKKNILSNLWRITHPPINIHSLHIGFMLAVDYGATFEVLTFPPGGWKEEWDQVFFCVLWLECQL